MSVQAADRLELDLERTFGGRRFTVRRVGSGYAVLEAGREVAVVGASGNAAGLWESVLDQLEAAGVIERCDRCGDDRARGAGWGRFCGHCADAYDDGADDDWVDQQNRRSA